MKPFLEQTAAYLVERYGDHTGDLCIVLPNRRAGLFLKEYLSAASGKVNWAPEIYSIEDLIQKLCGMQKVDNITLLFELYDIYRREKSQPEPFDEFCKWAQVFIQDINEMDRYLVDTSSLFGNLENIKEIENWSLSKNDLTEFQQQYLDFFRSLGGLYEQLKKRLLSKKLVYEGLAFRIVHDQLDERLKQFPWKKIIFAGLNAMNEAEERIVGKLLAQEKAEVLWDSDTYYMDDVRQEAGKFLRRLIPKFRKDKNSPVLWQEDLLSTDTKKITLIGAAKNIAQAGIAADILKKVHSGGAKLRNTAVVLADESLLFPMMHALPAEIENVNVTMGYPLKNTPFSGLVEILFNLHEYARRYGKKEGTEGILFYHKELLKLLSHPYIKFLFPGSDLISGLKRKILERNYVFVSAAELARLAEEDPKGFLQFSILLRPWTSPLDALDCFDTVITLLRARFLQDKIASTVETEYIFAFSKIFKRTRTMLEEYGFELDLKTLRSLVKQITASSSLPFYGEPLIGLQVMGVLETRTLDFENVIMLSVNENVIPSAKHQHTFIPFDLKKAFGLPTYSDKDAVFAYHFYRLLERAKNIYLLYNTETDDLGKGERSRFITQLLYELPRVNPGIVIEEQLVVTDNRSDNGLPVIIRKSQEVMTILRAKAEKGLSPSALNTYRNCSLQFYFRHVAGIREKEEVEETIAADTLGTAIHKVMEELYRPFLKKVLTAIDVKGMKKRAEALTLNAFRELYSSKELSHGKNLLTLRIAVRFLQNFLDAEITFLEKLQKENRLLTVLELEKPLEYKMQAGDLSILLHGNADRIDSIGGLIRIIDYKTGRTDDKELKFADWEELAQGPELNKSFQLLMYALLYQRSAGSDAPIQSGIITFRELSAGLKTVKAVDSELLDEQLLDKFEEELSGLLKEIFSTDHAFTQTTDLEICRFCDFKMICNRQ